MSDTVFLKDKRKWAAAPYRYIRFALSLSWDLQEEVWRMPIHLDALDVASEVEGLGSALIVACNMCAGASLAEREDKPFI